MGAEGITNILGWLRGQLDSPYPLVKYGTAAFLAFGTLYLLDAMGAPIGWPMAVVAFLGLLLFGKGGPKQAKGSTL